MTINNNNIFGLFTLNEARGSRLTGDWLHTDTIANYGWFGGGSLGTSPVTVSATVDRIDFSNELATASPRGSLSLARYGLAATGNSNYGWFGGGYYPAPLLTDPPYLSTVDRIDFSNDSSTSPIRGPLSLARVYSAATGNSNYGWFGGGTYYPYGGGPIPFTSSVDRIDFSNDASTASPRGPLSLARYGSAATGNSNYGWFGGGTYYPYGGGPIPFTSSVDRIDFSNDASTASPRGSLSLARYGSAATGNSNYGWFGGGFPGPGPLSTVDRIDFSNDLASASPRGSLSSVRSGSAATGNSNYGWFGGGYTPSISATVDRIDFSNDLATASPRGPLSSVRSSAAATGNSNYGWFGGGTSPAPGSFSIVDRINFSNDSVTASPRGSLSLARDTFGATSGVLNIRRQKAGNYGWFGGGENSPQTATVDRIDFSNDLAQASPRGSLTLVRTRLAATGNSNYGWFGGGYATLPTTRVDRIDFSNDSPAGASIRGNFNTIKSNPSATGNFNYGWFGGGNRGPASTTAPYLTTVERIDFTNDSTAASPRGSLITERYGLAATGNSNYGWFGGGADASVLATVERIDFTNDSPSVSPRGSLITARNALAATGNSNYGWWGGGATPTIVATVERIDFSNDSASVLSRGALLIARSRLAATGNSNYGWFGGGRAPSSSHSNVYRIDFSNDSVTTTERGKLSGSRYSHAATSNTPT